MNKLLLSSKQAILFSAFFFSWIQVNGQVGFISSFSGDQGGGTPLFNQVVPVGGDIFINWEVFVDGAACGSGTTGGGQGSDCRVIVRGMNSSADANSLVASDVLCTAAGNYNGENGNNDVFFANLNVCSLPTGRYSVEVQCDCMGGDYDNSTGGATAAATWVYNTPAPFYPGTPGFCNPSDPLDNILEISGGGPAFGTPQLEYFNVGDADVYRTMVVLNGLFLDMGKFQPGNPTLPTDLNDLQVFYDAGCVGVGAFPIDGFCGSDELTLGGAETNTTKRTDCGNADVTGNRIYYRLYENGTTPGVFTAVNIPFSDNCATGIGPANSNFPSGGSCQDQNGILDQRWQTTSAGIDLLALATTAGDYTVEFYTETDVVDCGGSASTVQEPIDATSGDNYYTSSFTRLDDAAVGTRCCPQNFTTMEAGDNFVCSTDTEVIYFINVEGLEATDNVTLVYFTAPTTDPYTGGTTLSNLSGPTPPIADGTINITGDLPTSEGIYYVYALLNPASGVCQPTAFVTVSVKEINCNTFLPKPAGF